MIEIIDLHKSFGDKEVLKGVNLTIKDGEDIAILGKSGEGKSVFLKHVIGLLKPDKGSVIVDGVDITKLSKRALYRLRKNFSYVFQGAALFDSMTVYENIALPLRERGFSENEVKSRVEEALYLVDLEGIENLYPAELSGGMKKRVGLARAIVSKPKYLLYDEPTTGLDVLTAWKINKLIKKLNKMEGITGVLVTHDIRGALYTSDKIALLNNGVIIEVIESKRYFEAKSPELREFLESGGLLGQ